MATRTLNCSLERGLESKFKEKNLLPILKQYGRGAFSYATLQDGMDYFIDEDMGYISYVKEKHPIFAPRGKSIVLGEPISSEEDKPKILRKFLEKNPQSIFIPVSEYFGHTLQEEGFKVNCVGHEPILRVDEYNTKGNWKELDSIKRARNEVKRNNIRIEEVSMNEISRKSLEQISDNWLKGKVLNDREIWIYARRPVFEDEEDVRKFVAFDKEDSPIGFVFYDPIYEDGVITGYSANISRCNEERYKKLSVAVNMNAIEKFREGKAKELNLCISPFDKVEQGSLNDDGMTQLFFMMCREFGEDIYNFKGLSFYKSKYRGEERPIYFASNSLMPVNDVYLAFRSSSIANGYTQTLMSLAKGIGSQKADAKKVFDRWKFLRKSKKEQS